MKIGIAGPILTASLKPYLNIKKAKIPQGLGGTSVNNTVISLIDKGYNVSVYSLSKDVSETIILRGYKLTIYLGKYRASYKDRMLDLFRKEYLQIRDFILKDKPDIVHAQWSYEFAIGVIKSNYPNLITIRDSPISILKLKKDLYRFIRLLLHLWVINKGANFSVVSPYLKEKMFIKKIDASIVPNFVQDSLIEKTPKTFPIEKIKLVSILSGWGKIKNPIPGLIAFSYLTKMYGDRIEYDLYGLDYEEGGKAWQWAKKNNCMHGVKFCGQVDHEQLLNKLRDYDILLHPSREESFGNALIEAMAKGLPIVAGVKSGAAPWVLNNGLNGILVNINKPVDIFEGILKVINDKNKYEQFSKLGLEHVTNNFSASWVIEKYILLYKKILSV